MKIMISQPMNGKTEEQIKEERKSVIEDLESRGYEVIDTVFEQDAPEGVDPALYFLGKSIDAMSKVDAVVFMKGWNTARGCIVEHDIAIRYGRFIMEIG